MTQPKVKGGVPPIEIYTIVGPDPVLEQDAKHEDEEFDYIEKLQKLREKQLKKNPFMDAGY